MHYPRGSAFPSGTCDRCHKHTGTTIMSIFNEDEICFDCLSLEEKHPDYQKAKDAESAEVRKGNLKFPGIGKPDDL